MPTLAKMVHALADSERVNINVCDADARSGRAQASSRRRRRKTEPRHLFPHPDERTVVPRSRPDLPHARRGAARSRSSIGTTTRGAGNIRRSTTTTSCPTLIAEQLELPVYLAGHGARRRLDRRQWRGHVAHHEVVPAQSESQSRPHAGGDRAAAARLPRREKHPLARRRHRGRRHRRAHRRSHALRRAAPPSSPSIEEDENDSNYEPLQANLECSGRMDAEDGTPLEVLTLPMPRKIVRDGQRLPASYANFYIANKVVLLPVFADTHDKWAVAVLQKAFPDAQDRADRLPRTDLGSRRLSLPHAAAAARGSGFLVREVVCGTGGIAGRFTLASTPTNMVSRYLSSLAALVLPLPASRRRARSAAFRGESVGAEAGRIFRRRQGAWHLRGLRARAIPRARRGRGMTLFGLPVFEASRVSTARN